jgi:hypothetical protein
MTQAQVGISTITYAMNGPALAESRGAIEPVVQLFPVHAAGQGTPRLAVYAW